MSDSELSIAAAVTLALGTALVFYFTSSKTPVPEPEPAPKKQPKRKEPKKKKAAAAKKAAANNAPATEVAPKKASKKKKKSKAKAATAKEPVEKAKPVPEAVKAPKPVQPESDLGGEWVTVKATKSNKSKKPKDVDGVAASGGSREEAVVDIGDMAGAVVGEKGVTINNIQNMTGAKLNTNRTTKTCTISGTAAQVDAARRMVEDILTNQNVGEIHLQNRLEEAIVRSPEHFRRIQSESGARVSVSSEGNGALCKLTGTADQIATAKAIITSLLQETGNTDTKHTITMNSRVAKQLIGRRGATVTRLEQLSGARIHINVAEPVSSATIIGSKEQKDRAVDAVQAFVRDSSSTATVPVDSNAIGMVLGNLNSLRTSSDVQIEVSDDRSSIQLTGTQAQVTEAKTKIINWINTELGPPSISPGQSIETIELGSAVGKVIGRGGSNISDLERGAPGVNVKVKLTTCYVYGEPSGVAKVTGEIKEIVEKHSSTIARAEKEEQLLTGSSWGLQTDSTLPQTTKQQWGDTFASETSTPATVEASDWGGALSAEGW